MAIEKKNKKPSYGAGALSESTRQSRFKSFFSDLNQKRKEKKDRAARNISNNNAANEKKIIEVLEEINFRKSKLDNQYLNFKSFETQECSDLELAKKDIIRLIVSNNNYTNLNLKEFDKRIYIIACSFRNAISNGHQNAAFSAKSALYIAIDQIRNQLMFIPENWRQSYLDECTTYLDKWIQLIEECISMDATSVSLANHENELQEKMQESQDKLEEYKKKIKENEETSKALLKVQDLPIRETLKDRLLCSIFNFLVDRKIEQSSLDFDIQMTRMQRRTNQMYATQVEMLRKNVQNVPVPKDKLSFQKFQASMQQMLNEIDAVDKQYEEFLMFIFKLDGELDRLEKSNATEIEKDIALKEMGKILEVMKKSNKKDGIDNLTHKEVLKELGLEEEQETNTKFVEDTEEEGEFNEN